MTINLHYDGSRVSYVTQSDDKVYRFGYNHNGTPVFMSYNNSQYWYHYDEHGNVIRMTDASGATVVKYKYDAWGNITEKTANSTIADINPYRYTGAEGYWYDENTNKYFLQARYYDPEIGRFLSKDPVELTIVNTRCLTPAARSDDFLYRGSIVIFEIYWTVRP